MDVREALKRLYEPCTALIAGIVLFLMYKLVLLMRYHDVRWDEAVFLSMGKFLFSGGTAGLWEPLRPPLWPLLLGLLDRLGDAVLLGELLAIGFGVTAAIVLYYVLKQYISDWYAVGFALMLLFSDVWFWYSSMLFTGIPSATLVLISFFLYTKNKHALAGFVAALAFLIRFPAGMGFAALVFSHLTELAFMLHSRRLTWSDAKPLFQAVVGFMAPVSVWLVSNAIIWREHGIIRGALFPLLKGSGNVFFLNTWLHDTTAHFYFTHFLFLLPVAFLAIAGFVVWRRYRVLSPFYFMTIFTLVFFTVLPNNQWRFALLIIPSILAIAAVGAQTLSRKHFALRALVIVLVLANLAGLAVHDYQLISHRPPEPTSIEEYYTFLEDHPVNGTIIVSDPIVAWYSPNPAVPAYYEFIARFDDALDAEPAAIFFVPRSFPCATQDTQCQDALYALTQRLVDEYRLVYVQEWQGYHYFIFSNDISLQPLDTEQVFEEVTYVLTYPQ